MYDVVIIGRGPAGVQAGIYTQRAGFKTLIIAQDDGEAAKAHKLENYYGFAEPISGPDLLAAGLSQAQRLGIEFLDCQVTGLGFASDANYLVKTADDGQYEAKVIILATGRAYAKASVPGAEQFLGAGLSYCATCDGFFYKGKTVGVLGSGAYALSEAKELAQLAAKVYILTDAKDLTARFPTDQFHLVEDKISGLVMNDHGLLAGVNFESGTEGLALDGLFVAQGQADSRDLANQLGVACSDQAIQVDRLQACNLPGVYAAGDCTGARQQISVAVGQGAIAGLEAADYLRKLAGEKSNSKQWG